MMDRRTFVGTLAALVGAMPHITDAQPTKVPRIGFLGNGDSTSNEPQLKAFHQGFALAAQYRLPAFYELRLYVEDGGLMSYGPSTTDLYGRSASYVDRILKGAHPGDLPVERPAKFEFVINQGTAAALGLAIPQSLLSRADAVLN